MNDETPKRGRRLLPVLLVTAAAAVALPVSAAVAGGDGDPAGSGTTTEQPGLAPVQEQEGEGQERRDGHDCPEGERGGQDDGAGADSSTTAL